MAKVKNKQVIRRFAFRELKSSRKMNVMVFLSIVLTCVLFTALTCIGGSLINGTQQETMRQVGGNRMAGLKMVLPEDIEKVKADKSTKDVVYRRLVGQAVNKKLSKISAEVDWAGDKAAAKAAFCYPTTGRLPEKKDEIAVSTIVLDELGLPHETGITVPLTLDVDGSITEHELTLTGFWEGEKLAMAQICWVSEALADECAPVPTERYDAGTTMTCGGYYMVDFNYLNSWDIEGKTIKLQERLYGSVKDAPDCGINWAYTTSSVDGSMIAAGIILLLVIFSAGYLIIYNIFYINISANIRSYGLLKTIGTTARQIERMVRVRAAVYCAVGIPLGLLTGVLLGKVMMSSMMNMMNIYSSAAYTISAKLMAEICVISSLFTYETVMISCRKPGRIAARVSPIEALRYNETDINTKKKSKKSKKISPLSVARNNMIRSRKKTVIVVLSLTLGMVLLNILFTALRGVDMDKFVSSLIVGDFIVTKVDGNDFDGERFKNITPEQMERIQSIEGISDMNAVYYESGRMDMEGEQLERMTALCDKYAEEDEFGELSAAKKNKDITTELYGISEKTLDVLDPVEGEIDLEKWRSGKYVIVYTDYIETDPHPDEEQFCKAGETVKVSSRRGREILETREYKVMAVCSMPYPLSSKRYSILNGQVIMPQEQYFGFTDNRDAMTVMINAEEDSLEEAEDALTEFLDNTDLVLNNKQTYIDQYRDFTGMIKLVGGTLSGILALIGILNFSNAVVTGMIARKREFAMMNAVGMTGRQLTSMLMWEGIHYAVLTAVFSAAAASLISCSMLRAMGEGLFFFTYHFTILPIVVCAPVLMALSVLIPFVSYRAICKDSIVDRLREN